MAQWRRKKEEEQSVPNQRQTLHREWGPILRTGPGVALGGALTITPFRPAWWGAQGTQPAGPGKWPAPSGGPGPGCPADRCTDSFMVSLRGKSKRTEQDSGFALWLQIKTFPHEAQKAQTSTERMPRPWWAPKGSHSSHCAEGRRARTGWQIAQLPANGSHESTWERCEHING